MGEIYDKWSVCDWKVRCWEQETTQVLPFGGEWMVESSCGVGADDSSKTRLNLVFEHMCNIVVCIPVKVYNMKKKTGLIVTFVSITSLYFYYI